MFAWKIGLNLLSELVTRLDEEFVKNSYFGETRPIHMRTVNIFRLRNEDAGRFFDTKLRPLYGFFLIMASRQKTELLLKEVVSI